MSRIIWRRAHPVRLPDKVNTPPHIELFAAYRFDMTMAEMERQIAAELERELRQQEES